MKNELLHLAETAKTEDLRAAYKCRLIAKKAADLLDDIPAHFRTLVDKRMWEAHAYLMFVDVHAEMPMRLDDMLSYDADSASIIHDVCGCVNNWNLMEQKMNYCWTPRYLSV